MRTCNRSCSSCGGFKVSIFLECSLNKHTALVVLAEGILVMSRSLQCSLEDISESRMYILYIYILDLKQQESLASHLLSSFLRLSVAKQTDLSVSLSYLDVTRHI